MSLRVSEPQLGEGDEMQGKPLAFLSYSRQDDEDLRGLITKFRQRLTQTIRLHTGDDQLELFQDATHIRVGEQWRDRIRDSLDQVTLLIPILTPRFFNSKECREELRLFVERERRLGRGDLVIPVYLIRYPAFENDAEHEKDELLADLARRHWADWRQVQQASNRSRRLQKAFDDLAGDILRAVERARTGVPAPPVEPGVEAVTRATPVVVPTATVQEAAVADDEPVEVGVASGTLVPGQADLFDLVLEGGLAYHIIAEPDDPQGDLDLELYDENNVLVAEDTTPNSDARCLVVPPRTGRYQLVVFCVSGHGYYRVFVAPEGSVDLEVDAGIDLPPPGVTTVAGALFAGEEDSFEVVLTADHPHEIYVRPDDPTADFDLQVYDENGNLVGEDATPNTDAHCIITPRWTGMFTVVVRAVIGASSYQLFIET